MKVHVVLAIHSNGTEIVGVYGDIKEAERTAEEYQAGAEENFDEVEFYVETHVVE
jgi:hypothetical protein